jgi:hypothetical protein
MRPRSTLGRAVPLVAFALLFAFLTVSSYVRKSATWDEPQQIVSGYAALELGDYRLDPEHPPFLRLWAALPLLFMDLHLDLESEAWEAGDAYVLAHEFMYRDNDADAVIGRARFMIVLLGIGLGFLLFFWARELFGFWPALGVLALYAVEPNVLAHARLVTTDFGVTCFAFGAIYFLWRTTRRFSLPGLLGAAVFTGLAVVSKYSALIFVPVVLVLLGTRVWRGSWPGTRFGDDLAGRAKRAATIAVALALAAYLAIWAAFGFRYAPTPEPPDQRRLMTSSAPYVTARAPYLATAVDWIDGHRLLPNASSQGFLFGQARAQQRPAYLGGSVRAGGWWFYFPAAFLIKTPLLVLALAAGGLAYLVGRWKRTWPTLLFLVLPAAAFLATSMTASINIGLRHILPVYPFVLLATGSAFAWLMERKRLWLAGAVLGVALLESLSVYPDPLTFFNRLVGGPVHGHEYLVDSNLDWGQDLAGLKRWMDREGVDHVNLSYFGTADPAYYGIACTHLTGGSPRRSFPATWRSARRTSTVSTWARSASSTARCSNGSPRRSSAVPFTSTVSSTHGGNRP